MNFAPYICQEVLAPDNGNGFRNEVCGRFGVNRSLPPGTKLPCVAPCAGLRGSAGSSIVLEACEFSGGSDHLYGAEVFLVEIPAQLIIRDSWMQAEVNGGVHGVIKNVVVVVDPAIDLDGPYMTELPAVNWDTRTSPVFDISTNNWQLLPPQGDLPEQLRPYQVGTVEGEAAPTTGLWPTGAVVKNRLPKGAVLGGAGAPPLGWLCVKGGQPGNWTNISTPLL